LKQRIRAVVLGCARPSTSSLETARTRTNVSQPSRDTNPRAFAWLRVSSPIALTIACGLSSGCIDSNHTEDPIDGDGVSDAFDASDASDTTADVGSELDASDGAIPDTSVQCTKNADCPIDLCVESMLCIAQRCIAGADIPCAATGNECTVNACNPTTGLCSPEALDPSTPCNDNDLCTQSDFCGSGASAGTCVGSNAVQCQATNDCRSVGTCNPLSGVCSETTKADGALCESAIPPNNEGTMAGTCAAGLCHRLPILAIGAFHNCAQLWDGTLRCWGGNQSGQLGRGDEQNVGNGIGPSVADNPRIPLDDITAFGLGLGQTCVISQDQLRCWGSNLGGGLGLATSGTFGTSSDTTPDKLPALDLGGTDFGPIAVAPSQAASCALSRSGAVVCWGSAPTLGYPGVAEVGTANGPSIAEVGFVQLTSPGQPFIVSQIVRTNDLGCALADGQLRCWGKALFLGSEATEDIGDDEPPATAPFVNKGWVAAQVSTIREHACAVSTVGGVYCWGNNFWGQIGTGDQVTNGRVAGPLFLGPTRFGKKVAAGRSHTCLLMTDGQVICWGTNGNGALGTGSTTAHPAAAGAAVVALGGEVWDIAAGWDHTCVVMRNGDIRCFGLGQEGRLGTNSSDNIGDGPNEMPPAPVSFE